MAGIVSLSNEEEFNNFIKANDRNTIVIHFGADWAPQCKQINDILNEVKDKSINTSFSYVEAEKLPKISQQYKISGVPTLLFLKRQQVIKILKGGNPREVLKAINDICLVETTTKPDDLNERLKSLINCDTMMLFMKGSPEAPQCGFSRKIVQLLSDCNAKYKSFDILSDPEIREGLKKFSNWPTYPQLYMNGELLGGIDIVQEMIESGDFQSMLKDADLKTKKKMDERLKSLINKDKVVLFMKGSPDSPKCGFSRNSVEILRKSNISFGHFDILSDDEVRQELKTYSNWPTYPQLYVNGELVGGFDILKELNENGELVSVCNE